MNRFLRLFQTFSRHPRWRTSVALDVGSAQTRVLISGRVVWSQPSLAVIHQATGSPVAVGDRADSMRGKLPSNMMLWQPVDRGQLRLTAETQGYIETVLKQALQGKAQLWFPQVMIGWSVGATPSYQRGAESLLTAAGCSLAAGYTQPEAVWRWLQQQKSVSDQGCILNIGHGVTEIGFFQSNALVAARRIELGSQDFSHQVQVTVRSQLQLELSQQAIEHLKRQLVALPLPSQFEVESEQEAKAQRQVVKGKHLVSQVPDSAVASSVMFQAGLKTVVDRMVAELQLFFRSLPSESVGVLLDQGIVVTGGGSQLSGLVRYLEESLQLRMTSSPTPELDVIQGLGQLLRDQAAPDQPPGSTTV